MGSQEALPCMGQTASAHLNNLLSFVNLMYFTKPFIWFHTSSYLIMPSTDQSFEWGQMYFLETSFKFLPTFCLLFLSASFRLSHIALQYNFLKYPDIFDMYPYYGIHYCNSIHSLHQRENRSQFKIKSIAVKLW